MAVNPTFGEYLRNLRKAAKLDQRELARRVDARLLGAGHARGFDVTYLSKIENDRVEPPSAEAVGALAEELGADQYYLMVLAGKTPPGVGRTLRESPGAQRFYRSSQESVLTEEQWAQLEHRLRELKGER